MPEENVVRQMEQLKKQVQDYEQKFQERKEIEAELQKFKFIIDNASEECYLLNREGVITYINQAVLDSLGYERQEVIGKQLAQFDSLEGEGFFERFQTLQAGESHLFETEQNTKDGRKVIKEIKAVYLQQGDDEYICGFGRDITDRKRMEEDLEKKIRELQVFYEVAIGREERILELKEELNELRETMRTRNREQT